MYRLGGWVEWGVMPNVLLQAVRWRSADTWSYMEIQAGDTDTRSGVRIQLQTGGRWK